MSYATVTRNTHARLAMHRSHHAGIATAAREVVLTAYGLCLPAGRKVIWLGPNQRLSAGGAPYASSSAAVCRDALTPREKRHVRPDVAPHLLQHLEALPRRQRKRHNHCPQMPGLASMQLACPWMSRSRTSLWSSSVLPAWRVLNCDIRKAYRTAVCPYAFRPCRSSRDSSGYCVLLRCQAISYRRRNRATACAYNGLSSYQTMALLGPVADAAPSAPRRSQRHSPRSPHGRSYLLRLPRCPRRPLPRHKRSPGRMMDARTARSSMILNPMLPPDVS